MTDLTPRPEKRIEQPHSKVEGAADANAKIAGAKDATRNTTERHRKPEAGEVSHLPPVSNFEKSGLLTNKQVQTLLKENFPPDYLSAKKVTSIKYVDELRPKGNGDYTGGRFFPDNPDGTIGHIEIYKQPPYINDKGQGMINSLSHEVCHSVHNNLSPAAKGKWEQIHQTSLENRENRNEAGFLRPYSRMNHKEDFADCCRAYQHDPIKLLNVSLDKYQYMHDNVYHGRIYTRPPVVHPPRPISPPRPVAPPRHVGGVK